MRLISELAEHRHRIDDNSRLIILETAFRVACADGRIEAQEQAQLQAIARALEINDGVLQLEIHAFAKARSAAQT